MDPNPTFPNNQNLDEHAIHLEKRGKHQKGLGITSIVIGALLSIILAVFEYQTVSAPVGSVTALSLMYGFFTFCLICPLGLIAAIVLIVYMAAIHKNLTVPGLILDLIGTFLCLLPIMFTLIMLFVQ